MRRTVSFKRLAAFAVGSCLLVASPLVSAAAAPQTAAAASASPDRETAQVPDAVTVASKQVSEKTEQYAADLKIPVLSGLRDQAYEAKLNEQLESRAMKALDELKKQAAEDEAAAQTGGYTFRPYEVDVDYAVKSDGSGPAGRFSLVVSTYTYTGGAHGTTVVDTYNVLNGPTASPLTLEQLLGDDYIELANAAVKAELKANPDKYYPQDGSDAFTSIADDQSFFVSNGTVYLVFQQYEIAPYASGVIEIPVAAQDTGTAVQTPPKKQSITLSPAAANAAGDAHYFVDAQGRAMIPLRAVASGFGYRVTWDQAAKTVRIGSEKLSAAVLPGINRYAAGSSAPVKLSAAPVSVKGTVYVPKDFFSRILGLNVIASPTGNNLVLHN